MSGDITQRKAHHLDLCGSDAVAFQGKNTLLDQVVPLHTPFPELNFDAIDLTCTLLGKFLKVPIIIASMSGGTEEAVTFNHDLAAVAEERGLGMGLGSMRPLTLPGGLKDGFFLRDIAPSILLMGNLGVVQARDMTTSAILDLLQAVGADALILHLNPAQERIQPGGDHNFTGVLDTLTRLNRELPLPVVVKETGCGISRSAALKTLERGIKWVDVSGAGGTSWVGVETLRATGVQKKIGTQFWDWGIPTGASLVQLADLNLGVIATGGIRHGLDIARSIALGAGAAGLARPFLMAHRAGGLKGLHLFVDELIEGLKTAMLLSGCRTLNELRQCPLVMGPDLQAWVPRESPLWSRIVNPYHR